MSYKDIFKEAFSELSPSESTEEIVNNVIERASNMSENKTKKSIGKRIAIGAAVAAAALSVMTIGVGAAYNWDFEEAFGGMFRLKYEAQKVFGGDEIREFDFMGMGLTIGEVYECDGGTLTVQGVIADDYNAIVMLQAAFEGEYKAGGFGDESSYDKSEIDVSLKVDGEDAGLGTGKRDVEGEEGLVNYTLEYRAEEGADPIKGKTLSFKIEGGFVTEPIEFDIDMNFDTVSVTKTAHDIEAPGFDGETCTIKEFIVTPLGLRVECDKELDNEVLSNRYMTDWYKQPVTLTYSDGSEETYIGMRSSTRVGSDYAFYSYKFTYPVNTSELVAITLDGLKIELS